MILDETSIHTLSSQTSVAICANTEAEFLFEIESCLEVCRFINVPSVMLAYIRENEFLRK